MAITRRELVLEKKSAGTAWVWAVVAMEAVTLAVALVAIALASRMLHRTLTTREKNR